MVYIWHAFFLTWKVKIYWVGISYSFFTETYKSVSDTEETTKNDKTGLRIFLNRLYTSENFPRVVKYRNTRLSVLNKN